MKIKKINPRIQRIDRWKYYLSKISKHLGQGKYLKYNIHTLAINLAKAYDLWCQDIYYYTAPHFKDLRQQRNKAKEKAVMINIREIESKLPTTWVKKADVSLSTEFTDRRVWTTLSQKTL